MKPALFQRNKLLRAVLSPIGDDVTALEKNDQNDHDFFYSNLVKTCENHGKKVVHQNFSVSDLASQGRSLHNYLTFIEMDSGELSFVWVLGKHNKKMHILLINNEGLQEKKIKVNQLASILKRSAKESVEWFSIVEQYPLESLKSSPSIKNDPVKRLRQLLKLDALTIRLVVFYAFAVGVLSLATPLAVQSLVNTVAFGTLLQPLVVLTLLLFVGLGFAGLLRLFEIVCIEFWQRRLFANVSADIAHRLPYHSLDTETPQQCAERVNRFLEVATLQKTVSTLLLGGVGLTLQTAVGLLVLAFYHPLLLAFDILLISALFCIVWFGGRGAVHTACIESKNKYKVLDGMQRLARSVYARRSEKTALIWYDTIDTLTGNYLSSRDKHFKSVLKQTIGLVVLQASASALLLGTGGYLVMNGQLTLGQLVASELIVTAVIGGVYKFGKHLEKYYDAAAAVDKLGKLIDHPHTSNFSTSISNAVVNSKLILSQNSNQENTPSLKDEDLIWQIKEVVGVQGNDCQLKESLFSVLSSHGKERVNQLGFKFLKKENDTTLEVDRPNYTRIVNVPMTQHALENTLAEIGFSLSGDNLFVFDELNIADVLAEPTNRFQKHIRSYAKERRLKIHVAISILSGSPGLVIDGDLDGCGTDAVKDILSTLNKHGVGLIVGTDNRDLLAQCNHIWNCQNNFVRSTPDA